MKNNFGNPGRPPFPPSSGGSFRDGPNSRPASTDENRVNERIRVPQVLVIDEKGVQLGTFDTYDAIRMAKERGLDLVEVAPNSRPPVCKILDYGKLKYTKKKKNQEAKKKQSVVNVKEMQLRPRTEENDFQTKLRHIVEFLKEDGDKVKVTVMFRGREVAYAQQGHEMLMRIIDAVKDFASPESYPKMEGRRMIMVLAPGKATAASPPRPSSGPVAPAGGSNPPKVGG